MMKRAWMEIPCNESMLDLVYMYQASTSKSTRILHLQKRNTKAQDDQILTLLKMAQKHLKKKHGNPVWRLKRRFVTSAVFLFPCDVYVTTRFCRRQTAPGARARSPLTQAYASRPWKRRCNLMLSFVFRLTRVSPFTKKVFWFIFCNVKMFQWIAPENIHTFFNRLCI